jgi:hypothetical protein
MADRRTNRGPEPVNDQRDITLQRLMDAEVALDTRRARLGLPESLLADLLDELEPESGEPVEDLYLRTIARYVAALGGRLEVSAVFGDETVPLLRLPPSEGR